jgi:hypothetical protein
LIFKIRSKYWIKFKNLNRSNIVNLQGAVIIGTNIVTCFVTICQEKWSKIKIKICLFYRQREIRFDFAIKFDFNIRFDFEIKFKKRIRFKIKKSQTAGIAGVNVVIFVTVCSWIRINWREKSQMLPNFAALCYNTTVELKDVKKMSCLITNRYFIRYSAPQNPSSVLFFFVFCLSPSIEYHNW